MGDSIHQDRPAKRLKMSPQMAQQPLHSHAHPRAHSHPHLFRAGDVAPLPADVNAFAAAGNAQAMADPWAAANSQLFDSSWKWPATSAPTSSRTTASPAMPGLTGLPGSDRPNGTWPAPPSSITTTTFVASSGKNSRELLRHMLLCYSSARLQCCTSVPNRHLAWLHYIRWDMHACPSLPSVPFFPNCTSVHPMPPLVLHDIKCSFLVL